MGTFFHVVHLGTELLVAIASLGAGGVATVPFSWKGKNYLISVAAETTTP